MGQGVARHVETSTCQAKFHATLAFGSGESWWKQLWCSCGGNPFQMHVGILCKFPSGEVGVCRLPCWFQDNLTTWQKKPGQGSSCNATMASWKDWEIVRACYDVCVCGSAFYKIRFKVCSFLDTLGRFLSLFRSHTVLHFSLTLHASNFGPAQALIHWFSFFHYDVGTIPAHPKWCKRVATGNYTKNPCIHFWPSHGHQTAVELLSKKYANRDNMGVSKNRGPPKSSILIGFSL